MVEEKKNRILQLRLNSEKNLNNSNNLFFIAQSMLILANSTYLNSDKSYDFALDYSIFGLILSFLWAFINYRHKVSFNAYRKKAIELIEEYKDVIDSRPERGFSGKTLQSYGLVIVFILFWIWQIIRVVNGMNA